MSRLFAISGTALAGTLAASLFAMNAIAQSATTDIGTLDKEVADKVFPAKPPYSPYAGRNFPSRPYFGERIRTPHIRWMQAHSARGSDRRMPIVSPRVRKSSPPAGNAPNSRDRWISSSSPTTRMGWAFSLS